MRIQGVILSGLLFICFTFADHVTLSGTVLKEDGTGIQGAELRLLKYSTLTATSDAAGAFSLVGDTITPISFIPPSPSQITRLFVNGSHLTVVTEGIKGVVSLAVVSSQGRSLLKRKLNSTLSHKHSISLKQLRFANGLYLVSLRGEGVRQVYKMILAGNSYSLTSAMAQNSVTSVASGKLAAVDTLIVTGGGYKSKVVDVTTYDQKDIICTLSVSNPWIPTGALEYQGGMVKIMANGYDFEMGQPNPNIWGPNTSSLEQPVHTVSFTYDFWMDTALVTQKEYDTLMSDTYADYLSPAWMEPYGVGDSMPTYAIMWGDAALYCNALSKQDSLDTVYQYDSIAGTPGYLAELTGLSIDLSKNGYRLPTEAEWEYACRGGTATDFYWGKNLANYPANAADTAEISSYTIWTVNSWDIVIGDDFGVYNVASKKPNAYGLYDMSGQLYEWCNDWDNFQSYTPGPVVDPTGPDSTGFHIARGGSWGNNATHLRSANRYFVPADYLYYFLGFRVVLPIQ